MKLSQAAAAPGPSRNAAAIPVSVDAIATAWVCRPHQNPPVPAASTVTAVIVAASRKVRRLAARASSATRLAAPLQCGWVDRLARSLDGALEPHEDGREHAECVRDRPRDEAIGIAGQPSALDAVREFRLRLTDLRGEAVLVLRG